MKYMSLKNKISILGNRNVVLTFGIVVILMILGVVAYKISAKPSQKEIVDLYPVSSPPENWSVYNNEEIGFEFKYPPRWIVKPVPGNAKPAEYLSIESDDLKWHYEYLGGDWPNSIYEQGGELRFIVDTTPYYHSFEQLKLAEHKEYLYPYIVKLSTSDLGLFKEKSWADYTQSELIFIRNRRGTNNPIQLKIQLNYANKDKNKFQEIFRQILSTLKV